MQYICTYAGNSRHVEANSPTTAAAAYIRENDFPVYDREVMQVYVEDMSGRAWTINVRALVYYISWLDGDYE